MQTIDWILMALMGAGLLRGWCSGLVRQTVSLVAFVGGLIVARCFYEMVGGTLSPHLDNHTTLANILAFFLIWIAFPIVLGVVGELVSTVLDKLFVLGTVNRFFGSLLGLLKYQFIIGSVLWLCSATKIIDSSVMQHSVLYEPLKAMPHALYTILIENGREK